jgi:hypothetical protein
MSLLEQRSDKQLSNSASVVVDSQQMDSHEMAVKERFARSLPLFVSPLFLEGELPEQRSDKHPSKSLQVVVESQQMYSHEVPAEKGLEEEVSSFTEEARSPVLMGSYSSTESYSRSSGLDSHLPK